MKAIFYRQIILSSSSSRGDIKAEMVTGITEPIVDRKINLKEAVCIPFSADKFAEGTFIFLGHWITYSGERVIQVEEGSIFARKAVLPISPFLCYKQEYTENSQ